MKKLRKLIVNMCKKNPFLKSVIRKLRLYKRKFLYFKYKNFSKTNEKLIVFSSYMGRSYSCSPRAIYEEMLKMKKFKDYTFVWAFKKPKSKKSIKNLNRSIIVKYNSIKFLKYCSEAKYIISNSRLPEELVFRNSQNYVQTWHGTPLKRLGYDLTTEGGNALNSLQDMRNKYKADSQRYTYLLSPSKFTTERLMSAFNLEENNENVKIIEQGYPRNDFMFKYSESDIIKIKKKCNISLNDNRKIILYAPTWRDNQHSSGVGYTYNLGVDFEKLSEKLKDKFIILFRPHYFVANKFDFEKYKDFVIDVSKYDDITELYCVSDLLITDYSSVFFDYANLKKPMIFYMYDKTEYEKDIRGFYISLDELPGSIVENENDLIEEISRLSIDLRLNKKYKSFNKKYNYLDDGKASKRVIREIFKKGCCMNKIVAKIEDDFLIINRENSRQEKTSFIDINKMKFNKLYKSKIKLTNNLQKKSIILDEKINFKNDSISYHNIGEDNSYRVIVFINNKDVCYYKAKTNVYNKLVKMIQKVVSIKITNKKIIMIIVAYFVNPYGMMIKNSFLHIDDNNFCKLKLNEYSNNKKRSKMCKIFKDLRVVSFDMKDIIDNETNVNNSCRFEVSINDEINLYNLSKTDGLIKSKKKKSKMYYIPMVSAYKGEFALHFRRTLHGNIKFIKRKKEEIEFDFMFMILESKVSLLLIKFISKLIKLFLRKKVNLFFEKYSSKSEEGAFDLFELVSKEKKSINYFIINKNSIDYSKISNIKNVVKQFSLKYYFCLFLSDNFISTEAPSHCHLLRDNNSIIRKEILKKKNIFLQHGITYLKCHGKNSAYIKGREAECDFVIVGSHKERDVIVDMLHMKEENILITGLPIFSKIDYKHITYRSKDVVTIMLTWKPYEEHLEDFTQSSYYKNVIEIYNHLCKYIDKNNINIVAHPKVNDLLLSTGIKVWDKPISEVLRKTKLMITDYSSICYNSFYQGSAVIFYQPDLEIYEKANGKLIPSDDEYIGKRVFGIKSLDKLFKENIVNNKIKFKRLRTSKNEKMNLSINEFTDGKNIERIYEKLKDKGVF